MQKLTPFTTFLCVFLFQLNLIKNYIKGELCKYQNSTDLKKKDEKNIVSQNLNLDALPASLGKIQMLE